MNEVNKTLFIPLYGKAKVSEKGIILKYTLAEKIWEKEAFPIQGKSKSKWLSYNMAMRARVFDDWLDSKISQNPDALILHIGCGLDSRYSRIKSSYKNWIDADFADVIELRKKYYFENDNYQMTVVNASEKNDLEKLPKSKTIIVVFEGVSMYLTNEQLQGMIKTLKDKCENFYMLLDVYTEFGAKISKYKNPVNDVGVTSLHGVKNIKDILTNTGVHLVSEHSFTPKYLIDQLGVFEKLFFNLMFGKTIYRKIYRLYEIKGQ
jgi:O-methyltransferase involved in polyketide biosynthesis